MSTRRLPYLESEDVDEFVTDYFSTAGATLLVGNVGFSPDVLYFPRLLGAFKHVDVRYLHERRPDVPRAVDALASERETQLRSAAPGRFEQEHIEILAGDGAPVGGRHACAQVQVWLEKKEYSDVVVDATGMSRGTCFPVVKQLYQLAKQEPLRVHLLFAEGSRPPAEIHSIASDRADWMHGFAAHSEMDEFVKALRLWVVQLSERGKPALQALFKQLGSPDEVCPVLPFPSANPRRADELVFELRETWEQEWAETPMSFILAHESDPMDVYRTISSLHEARTASLGGAKVDSITVLSPAGRRLPGLGMLLASLTYNLPIIYQETVGYMLDGDLNPVESERPLHRWHFRVDELAQS